MKRFLATTTAAAALLMTPAFAQQVPQPLIEPDVAIEQPAQPPADIIPGAETTQPETPRDVTPEASAETSVETETTFAPQTAEDTSEATATLTAESDIEVGANLPVEVAEVVADGDYNTEDLVTAQLAALQAQPLPEAPVAAEGAIEDTIDAEPALPPAG